MTSTKLSSLKEYNGQEPKYRPISKQTVHGAYNVIPASSDLNTKISERLLLVHRLRGFDVDGEASGVGICTKDSSSSSSSVLVKLVLYSVNN
jgi:hypothetical protein